MEFRSGSLRRGVFPDRNGRAQIDPSDDARVRKFALQDSGALFTMVSIVMADGGSRPPGSQLVVTRDECFGLLCDGCVDDDIALHALVGVESCRALC